MPVPTSTSFSNSNPSGLRTPRVESGVKMRATKFEAHGEDERFQPATDCRFSIADCRLPPLWRADTLLTVRTAQSSIANRQSTIAKGTPTHKDVKNEGRPDYVYENKARATKCHAKYAVFYTKMHPLHVSRQQSSGPFVRRCTSFGG